MYKIILFTLLSVLLVMIYALQVDRELAMHSLFQAKYALNRSTHAAAQQLDEQLLSAGVVSINVADAEEVAHKYLQHNLGLDSSNTPLPDTFLQAAVEVLIFEVVNEQESFPYTYIHAGFDYEVTIDKPGVIMIIRVVYPRTYNVMGPITWEIKSASEVVF